MTPASAATRAAPPEAPPSSWAARAEQKAPADSTAPAVSREPRARGRGVPSGGGVREEHRQKAAALCEQAHRHFGDGELSKAIEGYGEALQLEPSCTAAYAGRGGAKLRCGDAKGALADLNEALRIDPQNMYALRDRAEARQKTQDLRGALEDYSAKLSLAPADGRSFCGRGDTKLLMGDARGAIADYEVAVRLNYPRAKALLEAAKLQ